MTVKKSDSRNKTRQPIPSWVKILLFLVVLLIVVSWAITPFVAYRFSEWTKDFEPSDLAARGKSLISVWS